MAERQRAADSAVVADDECRKRAIRDVAKRGAYAPLVLGQRLAAWEAEVPGLPPQRAIQVGLAGLDLRAQPPLPSSLVSLHQALVADWLEPDSAAHDLGRLERAPKRAGVQAHQALGRHGGGQLGGLPATLGGQWRVAAPEQHAVTLGLRLAVAREQYCAPVHSD
jgi:hypothetical protein